MRMTPRTDVHVWDCFLSQEVRSFDVQCKALVECLFCGRLKVLHRQHTRIEDDDIDSSELSALRLATSSTNTAEPASPLIANARGHGQSCRQSDWLMLRQTSSSGRPMLRPWLEQGKQLLQCPWSRR